MKIGVLAERIENLRKSEEVSGTDRPPKLCSYNCVDTAAVPAPLILPLSWLSRPQLPLPLEPRSWLSRPHLPPPLW